MANLASYASISEKSTKLYDEKNSSGRSNFQKDRDRIIHSTAFRRLEYKTQVFINNEGDHYRTRLTHSIEVAQLARSMARTLGLDEDLSEAISLSHDLGHAPFGHAGEDILKELMKDYGGFDHNAQTIRILTKLEKKHAEFKGLNLTWECLEGLAKHNGPLKNIPRALAEYNLQHDLKLNTYPSMEAQLASIADDIAYNSHDIEDGIKAGLFGLENLKEIPIISSIISKISKSYPDISEDIFVNELRSSFIKLMVEEIVSNTKNNIAELNINSVDDVRSADKLICNFSPKFYKELQQVKLFLRDNMYRHYKVLLMTNKAKRIVANLFSFYLETPECLPTEWFKEIEDINNKTNIASVVADFIAGMTDRYAFKQHKKIYDVDYTNL